MNPLYNEGMFDSLFENACVHHERIPLSHNVALAMSDWLGPEQRGYASKRMDEYLAGRYCAVNASRKAEIELKELPMANDRSPCWPSGVVGSITHTNDIAIAVVSNKVTGLGIDVEKIIPAPRFDRIQKLIATKEEVKRFENTKFAPTLIFSAKETLYKALHPKCKKYFGFLEATLTEIDQTNFLIKLHSDTLEVSKFNGNYRGRYILFEDKIVTSLELT